MFALCTLSWRPTLTSGASEGSATAAATTILARYSKDSKKRASAVVLSKLLQYTITRP